MWLYRSQIVALSEKEKNWKQSTETFCYRENDHTLFTIDNGQKLELNQQDETFPLFLFIIGEGQNQQQCREMAAV